MKKTPNIKRFIYLVILLLCKFSIGQNETLFTQGNTLYNEGKYAEAIEKYEQILDNGMHSAELYFNIGNAHYKLSNVASSIYYFEKALQLAPTDSEIKNNLSYAQQMTIDAIEAQPDVGFSKLFKNVVNLFKYDTWAKLSVGFMLLFVVLFLAYYFSYHTSKKRAAFFWLYFLWQLPLV